MLEKVSWIRKFKRKTRVKKLKYDPKQNVWINFQYTYNGISKSQQRGRFKNAKFYRVYSMQFGDKSKKKAVMQNVPKLTGLF